MLDAEFLDSPSVYSHAYHSPDQVDAPLFDDDDDDESASTIRSLSTEHDADPDDASHRISLPGPRIRFRSRPPWETDDDGQEQDANSKPGLRAKASKADTLMRSLTRASFISGRPSIDSVRSQSSAASLEITARNHASSRAAPYDLARESISTSPASVRPQGFVHTTNYTNPSQSFNHTHSLFPRATLSLDGMAPLSMSHQSTAILSDDTYHMHQEHDSSPSQERQSSDAFIHPYANPDLVVPYTPSPEMVPSHHIISEDLSDSINTVADSNSVRSAVFSDSSTETSTTSLASRDAPCGHPRVNGKVISSPISVLHPSDTGYVDRSTRFLSLHPPPPGFDSPCRVNPRSPNVALISLQEAQARERIRSTTVHTTVARSKSAFPSVDDLPELTDQVGDMDHVVSQPRPRTRSTSVDTRHPTVPLPPVQVSEMGEGMDSASAAHGRALKHKKSGFMRLFTGRLSEGEREKSVHSSIPPDADPHAKQGLQLHGKNSKSTLPRASKSSLSPTFYAPDITPASTNGSDGPDGKGPSPRRRQPPALSIVTKASDHSISSLGAGRSSSTTLNFSPHLPLALSVPQSAPPGDTDFRGLKLRPVSSSFSSHFTGMVATAADDAQRDVRTPSSVASFGTALSPFTPVSVRRSDDTSATVPEALAEDQLTIKELQDQFVSAKKAWQQQIWELRGQIKDLTFELEDLRAEKDQNYCDVCGRGKRCQVSPSDGQQLKKVGVLNRPRAPTGDAARFASGN